MPCVAGPPLAPPRVIPTEEGSPEPRPDAELRRHQNNESVRSYAVETDPASTASNPSFSRTREKERTPARALSFQLGTHQLQKSYQINGILWIRETGASWRDLPARFGPWQTVYGRSRR